MVKKLPEIVSKKEVVKKPPEKSTKNAQNDENFSENEEVKKPPEKPPKKENVEVQKYQEIFKGNRQKISKMTPQKSLKRVGGPKSAKKSKQQVKSIIDLFENITRGKEKEKNPNFKIQIPNNKIASKCPEKVKNFKTRIEPNPAKKTSQISINRFIVRTPSQPIREPDKSGDHRDQSEHSGGDQVNENKAGNFGI